LVLGVLVATWHAPLFVAGIYRPAWLHFSVMVALAPFSGADMERALLLYLVGSLALAGVVTVTAWPRLTGARSSIEPIAPAPAPAAA